MNQLQGETSPYLLQHAQNPVDWYPWSEEAFERAKVEAFQGTDESSLVENLGVMVHVVAGEANNIKVTWLDDLGRSQGSLG